MGSYMCSLAQKSVNTNWLQGSSALVYAISMQSLAETNAGNNSSRCDLIGMTQLITGSTDIYFFDVSAKPCF